MPINHWRVQAKLDQEGIVLEVPSAIILTTELLRVRCHILSFTIMRV